MLILNTYISANKKVFLSGIVLHNRMTLDPEGEKAKQPPEDLPPPMDDENPEIVVKEQEKEEEPEEVEEKVDDEPIKCPICGSVNQAGSTQCFLCQTHISRKNGGKIKVESPKLPGEILTMVDIDDPLTKKTLEELTLIPGVSRVKALYLFQSGITSMEEFIEKAFRGERMSKNFSRTVTNKLLMSSIKDDQAAEEIKLSCPSCNAPNPADAGNCGVCGFEIDKDMQAVNMDDVSSKLNVTVDEVFGDLMKSSDFAALPEELKAQMAMAMESDDYDDIGEVTAEMELFDLKDVEDVDEPTPVVSEEEPAKEVEETEKKDDEFAFEDALEKKEPETEAVPEEPETVEEDPPEPAAEEPTPEPEPPEEQPEVMEEEAETEQHIEEPEVAETEPEQEPAAEEPPQVAEPAEVEPAAPDKPKRSPEEMEQKKAEHAEKLADRKQKIKDTLMGKLDQWRKTGYDVDDLEQYLDDLNEFKVRAKTALKKGKTVREKYVKQLKMWKEKGFDVNELEPLLETDIPALIEKAKEILKDQQ